MKIFLVIMWLLWFLYLIADIGMSSVDYRRESLNTKLLLFVFLMLLVWSV